MKKRTFLNQMKQKYRVLIAAIVCFAGGVVKTSADQTVYFFHTYLVQQGETITFADSYVDNTKSAFMSDILEPVAGNTKQFRFLGATGYYCFQSYDVNPFLRGSRLNWGTPYSGNYDDWKSDDIVNNNTTYNSHRFVEPNDPRTTKTDNGANGAEYIYVMPVNDAKNGQPSLDGGNNVNFQSNDLSWFDAVHNGNYFGFGHIWLVGSNAFGFPSVFAWKGDRAFKGWTDPSNRDNFVPMTQTSKNVNVITMRTGKQLNTKQSNFAFKFFASQGAWGGNGEQYGTNTIEYGNEAYYQFAGITSSQTTVDFVQLVSGGNVQGVNKDASAKNEAEKNSALPLLPLNYDLRFTVDLSGFDFNANHAQMPLVLEIPNRPKLTENANVNNYCEVSLTGTLIDKEKNPLWSDDGVNNYTLADALRFQANIAYADQVNTNYKRLKLNGTLTASDLTYLQWLISNGKVQEIDLSGANLPELTIPSNFVSNAGCTTLTTIVLPQYLNKIDANAFAGCTALSTVEFTGTETGGCEIGQGAFKNCTSLSGASIGEILKTTTEVKAGVFEGCLQAEDSYEISIPANISAIAEDAFKDCHINKVNVPAKYVAPTAKPFSVDRVGSPYNGPHNLTTTNNQWSFVEAEDFNQGTSGVAYLFNHNSNLSSYYPYRSDVEGAPVWKVGKPSNNHFGNCQSPAGESDKHLIIGDFETGDWMNYTVNVPEKGGRYMLDFFVAKTGGDGAFSAYIDGVKIGSRENIGGQNDDCNEQNTFSGILLSKGQHVIQFYCDKKLNFDRIGFQRLTDDTSADSDEEGSSSGYDGKVPTVSESAFTTDANHLEIAFADVSAYENEAERLEYIHEYKKDGSQWKNLITKDLYENSSSEVEASKKYDVCNQEYADVRLHRNFGNATNWETLVLPFDVKAGQEGLASSYDNPATVNTTEGKIKFAAIYIGTNGEMLRFLNVGTHNQTAAEASATEGSADYTITAGTPFIIYLDKEKNLSTDAANGDYVTFVDVDLKGNQSVNHFKKDGYWFCGTFDAITKHDVPEGGLWAMSGDKLMHATKTAKFKGYRCWFQTEASAATATEVFPYGLSGAAKEESMDVILLGFAAEDGEWESSETGDDNQDVEDGGMESGDGNQETGIFLPDGNRIEVVDNIYTLTGVRVLHPQKGIYIVNGKKMVIK